MPDNVNSEPVIRIVFGGLCSFVPSKDRSRVYVLMVATSRSKVTKAKLCRHDRYLVFRGEDLDKANGEFWNSFVALQSDGNAGTLCVWNIDGCELRISIEGGGEPQPENIDFDTSDLLDLGRFCNPIDEWWLSSPLSDRELVGGRVVLEQGKLSAGKLTDSGIWILCRNREDGQGKEPEVFAQTLNYSLNDSGTGNVVRLSAYNWKNKIRQELDLKPGSELFVSNLCPVEERFGGVERDVLAYYELCRNPIPQKARTVPHTKDYIGGNVTPQKSACPPVFQTVG